ncbi:hypothetical protein [Rhizobium sp.]|jgi:hypothetical protein|uniref:hypothetical protein n=1 Tax=Rhizobium sp. TaxID=391 RepID=UPI000E8F3691|nr:hypothetical protein [Rhizobium sp.]
MTPVEEMIERANRRHLRELSLAANKPASYLRPRDSAHCPHCQAVLTVAEIAERWCGTCRQSHEVQS